MQNTIEMFMPSSGIGDAICGAYVAAGVAHTGRAVKFYTKHPDFLARLQYENIEVLPFEEKGVDLYTGYSEQLDCDADRKEWYAYRLNLAGLGRFRPTNPRVDETTHDGGVRDRFYHEKYVVLAPFSASPARQWPMERWQELGRLLKANGYVVYAIGRKKHREYFDQYFRRDAGMRTWFMGFSADWIADLMLGAACVVGNDSAMAHYAGLLGVPCVAVHAHVRRDALFSYTNVRSVTPDASEFPCVFCRWRAERGYRRACKKSCAALANISAERVVEEVKRFG
jgi:hypothetical protein